MVILMQGAPKRLTVGEIKRDLESLGVLKEVHHIHLWQLDERRTFFEAHLVIDQASLEKMEQVKQKVREHLRTKYGISHSTLEIEVVP